MNETYSTVDMLKTHHVCDRDNELAYERYVMSHSH